MSRREETEGYAFSASAFALGGSLTAPAAENIETQAASVLSGGGGYGSARVENYRLREIISFDEATTFVTGSFNYREGEFSAVAGVTIKGLSILGVVTADAVVARLATRHRGGPKDVKPVVTTAVGSYFVNLRIAGRKVDPELNTGHGMPDEKYVEFLKKLTSKGTRRASLAVDRHCHNGLEIPQFGTVHIAEFQPDPFRPSLTMLRIELGCAIDGSTYAASVQGGGRGWP